MGASVKPVGAPGREIAWQRKMVLSGLGVGASGVGFRVSGFGLGGYGVGLWCFRFRVSRSRVQVLGVGSSGSVLTRAPQGFGFRISGFWFRIWIFGLRGSGLSLKVSGVRVSDFGFQVQECSGSGVRGLAG